MHKTIKKTIKIKNIKIIIKINLFLKLYSTTNSLGNYYFLFQVPQKRELSPTKESIHSETLSLVNTIKLTLKKLLLKRISINKKLMNIIPVNKQISKFLILLIKTKKFKLKNKLPQVYFLNSLICL